MLWLNLLCLIWGLVFGNPSVCSLQCSLPRLRENRDNRAQQTSSASMTSAGGEVTAWVWQHSQTVNFPSHNRTSIRARTEKSNPEPRSESTEGGQNMSLPLHLLLVVVGDLQCGSLSALQAWRGFFFNLDTKPGSWFDVLTTRSRQTPFLPLKMPFLQFQTEEGFPVWVFPTQGDGSLFLEVSG